MKIVWLIFLILGIALILFNIPVYVIGDKVPDIPDPANRLGFYIGRNLGFITGAIFLFIAYGINKSRKRKTPKTEIEELIKSIGSDNQQGN